MSVTFLTNEDESRLSHRIFGSEPPTTSTVGEVGDFYMDIDTDNIYRCISAIRGVYTWKIFNVPYFDLVAMGLPDVLGVGTVAECSVDCRDVIAAAKEGPIRVKISIAKDGIGGYSELVLNSFSFYDNNIYARCITILSLSDIDPHILTIELSDDGIKAWLSEMGANTTAPEGAVLYTEQDLTDEQKAQARANIGATADKLRSNNLIDMSNPTSIGSDWTYNADSNSYSVLSVQANLLRFNFKAQIAGKITMTVKVTGFSGSSTLSIRIRNSSNTNLAICYPNADGVYSISCDIAEAGDYHCVLSSGDAGVSAEVSEIMLNYGEKKNYEPYYLYSIEDNFKNIEKRLTAIETGGVQIATYNLSALTDYIEAVKILDADVKIPVMTDLHTEKLESYAMLNHLAKSGCADMCIALGDYIPTYYATKDKCFELLDSVVDMANRKPTKSPVFMLRGNHDTNIVGNTDSTSYLSDAEFYDRMETRTKNINGVSRKNYGYVDLESAKVRVVMLDAADVYDSVTGERLSTNNEVMIQQEQFAWLANVALDFTEKKMPADWSVIVFSHANLMTLSNSGFRKLIDAFTNGKDVTINDSCAIGGYTAPLSATTHYSEQGAMTFICTVSGHQHADMVRDIASTSYPNIAAKEVFVAAENSGSYYLDENGEQVWYTRTPGTIEEHCFDTVCIDKTNRKVIFKRLGVGSDREISY